MKKRYVLVPVLTLLATLLALELVARAKDLDRLQYQKMAVDGRRLSTGPWTAGEALGVDYLPRAFRVDDTGFQSLWGWCAWESEEPTILVLGDSTTRMTGTDGPNGAHMDDTTLTWPALMAPQIDARICVIAEDGYHPADYARILRSVGPRLQPELVITLLCENDLNDRPPRIALEEERRIVLYEPPTSIRVWPKLYYPRLYAFSEAFRWFHFYMATQTGDIYEMSTGPRPMDTLAKDAIADMVEAFPEQRVFFLPPLTEASFPRRDEIERASGVPLEPLSLSDPIGMRRNPEDLVHVNEVAHAEIAAFIAGAIGPL